MLGMIGIILVFSFLVAYIYCRLVNSKFDIISLVFWGGTYWMILSAIKWVVGDSSLTLMQSFWDIVPKTYLHYSLLLLVAVIIMPIVYRLVFKERGIDLMRWSVSLGIIVIPIAGYFSGGVAVGKYVILYWILIGISAFMVYVLKLSVGTEADKIRDFSFNAIKEYCSVSFFSVFYVIFYLPNELFLTNAEEFLNSYWSLVIILLIFTVIATVGVLFLIMLLPKKWRTIATMLIFSLTLCEYVQSMLLNGQLDSLTGEVQTWSTQTSVINVLIWIVIIVIVLLLSFKFEKIKTISHYVSIFMTMVLIVTIFTLIVQNTESLKNDNNRLTNKNAMEISSGKNVLVFVLDYFDTTVMEELIEESSEFVTPLNDFVFYNNVVPGFPRTLLAIPHLLTGSDWKVDETEKYRHYAYNNNCFMSKLYNSGIRLDIYTDPNCINEDYCRMIDNYEENIKIKSNILNTCKVMYKTSLYKVLPFVFKKNYLYYTSDITDMVIQDTLWSTDNDIYFYNMIENDGLKVVDSSQDFFKFYHMRGDHPPYYLSEDIKVDNTHREVSEMSQAKACLNIVYEYLEELKRIGKYDDTTIIITADHGNVIEYLKDIDSFDDVCIPIMMVKKADQKGNGLQINSDPYTQKDLLATILDVFELDYEGYECRLGDEVDENRERMFNDQGSYKLGAVVVGDAHDVNNWKLVFYFDE